MSEKLAQLEKIASSSSKGYVVEVIKGYQQACWYKFTTNYLDGTFDFTGVALASGGGTTTLPNSEYFTKVQHSSSNHTRTVTIKKAGRFLCMKTSDIRDLVAGDTYNIGSSEVVAQGIAIVYPIE